MAHQGAAETSNYNNVDIFMILLSLKKKKWICTGRKLLRKKMTVSIHSPAAITHSVQFLINTANQLITWPGVMRTAEWGRERRFKGVVAA